MNKKTLVVNLLAGPGSGKSTLASGIFFDLKMKNINVELTSEFCKDLVYEERHHTMLDQIYIFGKQFHRIFRLLGKVDVIITDSPLLLSSVYDSEKRETFKKFVLEEHQKMWTYDVFIKRKKVYSPKGRSQTENEAKEIDKAIVDMLFDNNIPFETFEGTIEGKDLIVKKILLWLEHNKII
jgi:hypothetical protein